MKKILVSLILIVLGGLAIYMATKKPQQKALESRPEAQTTEPITSETPTSSAAREPCPEDRPACPEGEPLFCRHGKWVCGGEAQPAKTTPPSPAPTPVTFSGTVLAGNKSQVIDFNKADFDKAIASKKLVVLYFYANWCPICREEIPRLYEAFNSLSDDRVLGFRVNYNDNETDGEEKKLAEKQGVLYQHTKVFLKNGQRIFVSPESWDKDRYLLEIDKALDE